MALVETVIGIVVAVSLAVLSVVMTALTVMSIREDVHSPAPQDPGTGRDDSEGITDPTATSDG